MNEEEIRSQVSEFPEQLLANFIDDCRIAIEVATGSYVDGFRFYTVSSALKFLRGLFGNHWVFAVKTASNQRLYDHVKQYVDGVIDEFEDNDVIDPVSVLNQVNETLTKMQRTEPWR